jgi:hypothetical protein
MKCANENSEELKESVDSMERILELFDSDPRFGPCVGITRE